MPDFLVRFMDPRGAVSESRVQAADAQSVAAALGISPGGVLSVAPASIKSASSPFVRRRRFPLRLFSRELAVLLRAGIPLLEALTTLREKEASGDVAAALDGVIERLRRGEALSAAFASQSTAFDELFVAVVASAERTGQIEQALTEHSQYLAWVEDLQARLVAAALYPMMLVGTSGAVILFLLVFVVPRFAG
ncbi:MAG: type II secretion system F family protein, partial [Methylibium sp.]|nr:type II secretion system F family protein [Methylibium sp.]